MSDDQMPRQERPCTRCPWRLDTPAGQFAQERYDSEGLRSTSPQGPDSQPTVWSPLFACHKSPEGREKACAGWLAAVGSEHPGVRLAVAQDRLPAEALSPGEDWPPLFASYTEMAAKQAAPDAEKRTLRRPARRSRP
ncbi:DUF6283 family protein [Streptomyces sp. ME02-6987-2C]|uniref:DUF6283 family protein n=1 Tax=unclassified Streptomyces TaxID=2593676 RepID=UPI0029AA8891|nr:MULTISPECIES: DUF6283 family protein [unclassified Streptomyces]MDX3345966.1 DUF6283 family protein [Streptomyces sp. ME02-6979A]MDX3368878.1 DUF6283 family protein [Streptomyces sp. ME02-6987-2C]MDX3407775.1 DUF6283 family protein [Streptomyces sp. ME02-6977A]MDX3421732.1 DUF6283 family protein [Streptomyces sp. ME02-6985-2c]